MLHGAPAGRRGGPGAPSGSGRGPTRRRPLWRTWGITPLRARRHPALKKEGEVVGFIGDGANDATALISADVGICLREGSSLARETASILLQKDDLGPLPWAYAFSKQTITSTRENFYLSTGLNSGILVLALLGKSTPLLTSILHNSITVGILLRSLSLSGEEKK